MESFLRRLIGQVLQVLLDQGSVFLRIFFGLGLKDCGAIALWQTDVATHARGIATSAVGSAGAVPVALLAVALGWGSATAAALPGLLALSLAALSRLVALALGHLRTESRL